MIWSVTWFIQYAWCIAQSSVGYVLVHCKYFFNPPNMTGKILDLLRPAAITVSQNYCVKSVQIRSFFLVGIFQHSDWIRRDTEYLSVFTVGYVLVHCKYFFNPPNMTGKILDLLRPAAITVSQNYCVKSVQIRSFFLVGIFQHSDWIRRDTEYLSVFTPNTGKYGPEKTPYLDTFHTALPIY